LNYLGIGIGVGATVSISLKICAIFVCRPLANDIKVARTLVASAINWSHFSGHSRVRLWVDIALQTQCWR